MRNRYANSFYKLKIDTYIMFTYYGYPRVLPMIIINFVMNLFVLGCTSLGASSSRSLGKRGNCRRLRWKKVNSTHWQWPSNIFIIVFVKEMYCMAVVFALEDSRSDKWSLAFFRGAQRMENRIEIVELPFPNPLPFLEVSDANQ